jgi:hypothetical protein
MTRRTDLQPFVNGQISALYVLSGRIGVLAWTLFCVLAVSYVSAALITWAVPAGV